MDVLSGCPQLHSLFINLVTEEEVDYVLKKLHALQFLNGLGVDREELQNASIGGVDLSRPERVEERHSSSEGEEDEGPAAHQRMPKAVALTTEDE